MQQYVVTNLQGNAAIFTNFAKDLLIAASDAHQSLNLFSESLSVKYMKMEFKSMLFSLFPKEPVFAIVDSSMV